MSAPPVPSADQPGATALAEEFTARHGRPPTGVWGAPGRVNLIGEHTDYNDGFVFPFALPQRVLVAAAPAPEPAVGWTVASVNTGDSASFAAADLRPPMPGWSAYVAGVVWALREAGHSVAAADLVLVSDVPIGAGLSSSAALECAVLAALVDLNGLEIAPLDRAKLARRCENEFVGAPTGLMDQAASTLCTAGHGLLLDCRTLATEQVPLDPATAGLEILVVDTGTAHALVDSEYADRRRSCEAAADQLGVPALRDVDDVDRALSRLDDEMLRRRVRHVVTENARVRRTVEALAADDWSAVAVLLDSSHASMRDDFEITVPPIDVAVEAAKEAGALGSRMTGGGFGGCIIALVPTGSGDRIAAHIGRRFAARGYGPPAHFVANPSAGAGRVV
ncbi:MAG: galactokinase [Propionibacteriaceae bacterium]